MMPGFHGVIIGFVISNRFRAPERKVKQNII